MKLLLSPNINPLLIGTFIMQVRAANLNITDSINSFQKYVLELEEGLKSSLEDATAIQELLIFARDYKLGLLSTAIVETEFKNLKHGFELLEEHLESVQEELQDALNAVTAHAYALIDKYPEDTELIDKTLVQAIFRLKSVFMVEANQNENSK